MKRPFIIKDKRILIVFLVSWILFMFLMFKDNFGYISTSKTQTGEWTTVTHPLYGFSLEYPDKWRVEIFNESGRKGAHEVKLLIRGREVGFSGIVIKLVQMKSPTVEDAALWDDIRLTKLGKAAHSRGEAGYKQISLVEDEINGTPAIRRVYRLRDGQFEAVYIARANNFIIITLQTTQEYHDKYKEDFERVLESFRPLQ